MATGKGQRRAQSRSNREVLRLHDSREMVHRRHGFLRRVVLNSEQLHLFSRSLPAVPGVVRLGQQNQLDRHIVHGGGNYSTDVGRRRC